MISTLTVSGGLSINQLARKENLVVQLDASPSTYTAYPFNSGSQSGTSGSVLTWNNRWTDLSGNNNHAYAFKFGGGSTYQVATYDSGGWPLSSSYLNNSVFIDGFTNTLNPNGGLRFNPIIESTGPLSIFLWLRPRVDITGATSAVILDKRSQDTALNTDLFSQYAMTWNPSTGFAVGIYYTGSSNSISTGAFGGTLSATTWYNIGFTLTSNLAGGILTSYLNGVAQSNVTLVNDMYYANKQIIIGRRNQDTSNRAAMDLSQFLIYNVALTPQEIWNNYQITKYKHQT
jgi:hypothetical protein